LRKLPARDLLLFVALLVGVLAACLGFLSLPWVKTHGDTPPRVEVIARGGGPLEAGVGVAPIDVPLGAPIAGFAHLAYRSDGADPVTARAIVLCSGDARVAIVSAEILLVPDSLRAAVMARLAGLQLSGVILGVTHTHASPGGYYENLVAERAGLGPYDPAMRDLVANAMAESVRRALATEEPARLSVATGRDGVIVKGRDGADPDGRITVLRVDRPDGKPLAELTVFASHPTSLGIHNRRISGDWPARFYAHSQHGVRLFLQGAVGDQSAFLPESWGPRTPEAYGAALDRAVKALSFGPPDPAPTVAYAAADVTLPTPRPPITPAWLRQAATNVASTFLPTQARVSALRLGPVVLLLVPGEVMSGPAARWREMAGAGAEIVSLADGYLGYVDSADRVTAQEEAHPERSYYGPELAPALERGLSMVVGALREADKPLTGPGPVDTAGTGGSGAGAAGGAKQPR
jgi:neutral ceramidase